MELLSIVVPAWNEGKTIHKNLVEVGKTLEGILKKHKMNYEIILVDDGSHDSTYKRALSASRKNGKIKVIRKERGGKGSALKHGFNFSKGNLVTFMDADLDIHPWQIDTFLEHMKNKKADVVIGSKRHPESKVNYPFSRRILSACYQGLTYFLFGLNLTDTQAGLKMFKRKVLEKVLPKTLSKKYAFDLELLVATNLHGFKIVEAPIERQWMRFSSRVGLRDIWHIWVDTLAILYRQKILRWYD